MLKITQILLIAMLLNVCGFLYYFIEPPLDPSLELIAPKSTHLQGWAISPGKDKISYSGYPNGPDKELDFLFLPATKQTHPLPCFSYWLSNDHFYCDYKTQIYEVDPTTFTTTPITFETYTLTTTNLSQQLAQAQEIYVLLENKQIWLKHAPQSYVLMSQIENLPDVLSNTLSLTLTQLTYLTSNFYGRGAKKIYSPNQAYYFGINEQNITIYDATSNAKLVEHTLENKCQAIFLAAWAEDSSGVYFTGSPSCPIYNPPSAYERQILKLKVPKP